MLRKQKENNGEVVITTVLFDDELELLHDRIDLQAIRPLTKRDYFVRGTTALLDAMGKTIQKMINVQRNTIDECKAKKVLFVITTDGQENASREYGYTQIKALIKERKEMYGWEFIFLGANIVAMKEANKFGIEEDRVAQFHNDAKGIEMNYASVSEAISELRSDKNLSAKWKENIDEDYKKRNKK